MKPELNARERIARSFTQQKLGVFFLLPVNFPTLPGGFSQCTKVLDWDRSLPPPVADEGRRSVGNRKERQNAATMRVPRTLIAKLNARERLLQSAKDTQVGVFFLPLDTAYSPGVLGQV